MKTKNRRKKREETVLTMKNMCCAGTYNEFVLTHDANDDEFRQSLLRSLCYSRYLVYSNVYDCFIFLYCFSCLKLLVVCKEWNLHRLSRRISPKIITRIFPIFTLFEFMSFQAPSIVHFCANFAFSWLTKRSQRDISQQKTDYFGEEKWVEIMEREKC